MRPRDYDDGLDADGYPETVPEPAPAIWSDPGLWRNSEFRLLADVAGSWLPIVQAAMELRPKCESPIEVELGAHLTEILKGSEYRLVPQYEWRGFRNDFAIVRLDRVAMFIECDGKEFHSTPEQIRRDRRKDAAAKADGIPLLRFTGSEIFHNSKWIAKIVLRELEGSK